MPFSCSLGQSCSLPVIFLIYVLTHCHELFGIFRYWQFDIFIDGIKLFFAFFYMFHSWELSDSLFKLFTVILSGIKWIHFKHMYPALIFFSCCSFIWIWGAIFTGILTSYYFLEEIFLLSLWPDAIYNIILLIYVSFHLPATESLNLGISVFCALSYLFFFFLIFWLCQLFPYQ